MSSGDDRELLALLARDYSSALRDYVLGAGEAALLRAYELGRKAVASGVGLLELAVMHHEALLRLPTQEAGERPTLTLAAEFLTESLSPYEMTLRAFQANARLLGLSGSLAQENAEIDRSREQLRTILDATTALIYLKDSEGRYLFANRQFQRVFGVGREQALGRTDEEVLAPANASVLRDNDRRVIERCVSEELEETLSESDGPHTYISLKFPLLDASGAVHAICCVSTDITERKRTDEALRRAIQSSEDANRELESFSYSVAHDLRAPLRSIDGFSQALLEDYEDQLDAEGKRYLGYVRQSARHMGELIEDLLALSRVSRGDVRRTRVDLTVLARDIAERLAVTEPGRRVEFMLQDGLTALADVSLVRAVLENLLGNAWKFTAKREVARIEVGQRHEGDETAYFVRDNGAGFDMAYKEKLFGVFQRLHSAGEFEGNGIGLATVQRIIRRHGGRIWAEGAVGEGATFYFTIEGRECKT